MSTHSRSPLAPEDTDAYHQLCAYTLSHRGNDFIHQHVVDAYAVQHAHEGTKPIALTFALIGLYLSVEKGISGRQVQRFHMQMARTRKPWPRLPLPSVPADISARDVIAAPPGPERDARIHAWAAAVWRSCPAAHDTVRALARSELAIVS